MTEINNNIVEDLKEKSSVFVNWVDNETPINAKNLNVINDIVAQVGADVGALSLKTNELDLQLEQKVDKNGIGQITIDMLSQSAKDVIKGEAPLTNVGIGGVNVYDLSDPIMQNLYDGEKMSFVKTQDGGFMSTNLSFSVFSGYYYSLITNLIEGELLNWTGWGRGSVVYGIIFVDSSNRVISKHFVGNDSGGIFYNEFVRVPSGTFKAYFNFKTDAEIKVYKYKLKPVSKLYELQEETKRAKYAETHVEPTSLTDAIIYEKEASETIVLTSQNTELLENKVYNKYGAIEESNGSYSTIYYKIGKYKKFLLSNYRIGVYGGAFLKDDKKWISSFATDGSNADILKEVPSGAEYIAITVRTDGKYRNIEGYYTHIDYKLNNLMLDSAKLTDAEICGQETTKDILLNESNTELLSGKIYNSLGNLETSTNYSTLYFKTENYSHVVLSNYRIGVYGGAFVTQEKTWLSSFATDGNNADIKREIPKEAYYIAITVNMADMYKKIKCYTKENLYNLKNLVLKDEQEITKHNQWRNKKIGFLGTSVLFGSNATKSYSLECANKLGFVLKNFGVPGLAIHTQDNGNKLTYGSFALTKAEYQAQGTIIPSSPMNYVPGGSYNDYYRTYENVFTEENKDIDLWVFAVAPNNGNFDLKDWNAFDKNNWRYNDGSSFESHRTTFMGALLFLMDKMYELNPNARMVLLLDSAFAYSNGKNNFEEMKKQWNIPIIDLWGKINTSPKSLIKLKSKNGTDNHPSDFGHTIMGNMLANEILLIS